MADEFFLKMPYFHVTFRDLLHAVNLRHSEGRHTKDIFALKNPTASAGVEPAWVPNASTLLLDHRSRSKFYRYNGYFT